jgi:hypothetical protein
MADSLHLPGERGGCAWNGGWYAETFEKSATHEA